MSVALDAWLYGTRVGTLTPGPRPGSVELSWTARARERWGIGSRVVSHLLPVPPSGAGTPPARVRVWLEGLLPEGALLTNLAVEAGVEPDDTLGFLAHYGRDTAGAVLFVPAGEPPEREGSYAPVTDTEIGDMLRRAESRRGPRTDRHDSLTSLAGLEPKIALARAGTGAWLRCLDGAASTHILKLSRPESSPTWDVIDTEAAALDLARRIGLTTVDAEVATYGGARCIVVSRYDRVTQPDGRVERVHQEDAAQALGISTRDPGRKAQHGRALPSLAAIAEVLRAGGSEPDDLLRLTTFNLAVGNTDAHAKNISFVRYADGTAQLAPAYDVAMHLHSPVASGVFAMDVRGARVMADLTADALVDEGVAWGIPRRRAVRAVAGTLDALSSALAAVDRGAHPGVGEQAWATVERRTNELAAQAAQLIPPPGGRPGSPGNRSATRSRLPKGRPGGGRFAGPHQDERA